MFFFKPTLNLNQWIPFLEIPLANGDTIYRDLKVPLIKDTNEVLFTVLNKNRVLGNEEKLLLQFTTNANAKSTDMYSFQIKVKEKIVYSYALSFNASSTLNLSIEASKFPIVNGGIL